MKRLTALVILFPLLIFAQDQGETVGVPETEEDTVEDIGLKPGDDAPKFALRSTTGDYELLSKWCGETLSRPASQPVRHVVVASFFATWCIPCMKELPHLQNLYEKYGGEDIKFFLIDITEATRGVEGFENSPKAGPFLAERKELKTKIKASKNLITISSWNYCTTSAEMRLPESPVILICTRSDCICISCMARFWDFPS